MVNERINWVDYGKGICIILVVMMHSTYGWGAEAGSEGWMHALVSFAQPIRMPDFFLIAGLFFSRSIDGPWRDFIDRKVIHFAYFYLLWLAVQSVLLEPELLLASPLAFAGEYLRALIFPSGSLWFIHQLIVFYLLTRVLRKIPKVTVLAAAILLHTLLYAGFLDTGWSVTDRVANWYVFFFSGYAFAPLFFAFADRVAKHAGLALAGLVVWVLINGAAVASGIWYQPGVSLALGYAGAGAIIAAAALMVRFKVGGAIRYAGQHSIVIYLTFFIPMKMAIKALAIFSLPVDVGTGCLIVLTTAIATPLLFHRLIRKTPLNFLYVRPALFRLSGREKRVPSKAQIAPAE